MQANVIIWSSKISYFEIKGYLSIFTSVLIVIAELALREVLRKKVIMFFFVFTTRPLNFFLSFVYFSKFQICVDTLHTPVLAKFIVILYVMLLLKFFLVAFAFSCGVDLEF